ncbi:hypothetical protein CNR22_07735 [Sphingobacteriaceae bacterium]|nr:hypothetical protein CNR22_07735 [Sphingobacteriaceae bacterium]
MLLRFSLFNMFSFGETKEINMLSNNRIKRLEHHKYKLDDLNIVKMASIYGANGSGKSNLIKALSLLKKIVISDELPFRFTENSIYKFNNKGDKSNQILAIEFIQDNVPYYYAIDVLRNIIQTEELYRSGLGKNKDQLIFERTTDSEGKTKLKLSEDFESDKENLVLKSVIEKNLAKNNSSVFKLLSSFDSLSEIKAPFNWFKETLQILTPKSKPLGLVNRIDKDSEFHKYAEDIMCSFHIGINSLKSDKKNAKDFFGEDNESDLEDLIKRLEISPSKMLLNKKSNGDEFLLVKEDDEFFVKQLKLEHVGRAGTKAEFHIGEESDGTIRILDFVPLFKDAISKQKVFIIDEIERSIHPLLIKELVKKFSDDEHTTGQIIFTTHESNLLDQDIFRQDEIWFTEKDKNGCTDLYSLSDFKEHNTIDIRKGYLNGRYGSIPFLGNLKDLNWHNHDSKE